MGKTSFLPLGLRIRSRQRFQWIDFPNNPRHFLSYHSELLSTFLLFPRSKHIQRKRCHPRRKKKWNQSHWLVEWVLILKWVLSAYQTLGLCQFSFLSVIFVSFFPRKSTFFNILTKSSVPAENFPFCTINPNESQFSTLDWTISIGDRVLRSSTSAGPTIRFLVPVLRTIEVEREPSSFELSFRFLFSKQPAFLNVNERSCEWSFIPSAFLSLTCRLLTLLVWSKVPVKAKVSATRFCRISKHAMAYFIWFASSMKWISFMWKAMSILFVTSKSFITNWGRSVCIGTD